MDTYSVIMTFDVMVEMCETIALHVFRIDRVFLDIRTIEHTFTHTFFTFQSTVSVMSGQVFSDFPGLNQALYH